MFLPILIAISVSFLPKYALAEQGDLCDGKTVPTKHYKTCDSEELFYRDGKNLKKGQLFKFFLGTVMVNDHVGFSDEEYYLITPEDKIIPLGSFPQRGSDSVSFKATYCLTRLLKEWPKGEIVDWEEGSTFLRYPFSRISNVRYQLENNTLVTYYDGLNFFEGSARSVNGETCTGDLKFKKEYVDWKEAEALCEKSFANEFKPEQPEFLESAHVAMQADTAGTYYICSKRWQRLGPDWKIWNYRIDLQRKYSKPVFLNLNTRLE